MLKFKLLPTIAGAAALMLGTGLVISGPANAAPTIFDLTVGLGTGIPATGSYGTVTLTPLSTTEVGVEVKLTSGEVFAFGGAGASLLFNLSGNPDLTNAISGVTSPFTATSVTSGKQIKADGSGYWEYSIDCTSCSGTSDMLTGPLDFNITLATGITPADFISTATSSPYYFAADIGVPCGGNTGLTCAPNQTAFNTGDVAAVPAPPIGHGLSVFLAVGGLLFGAHVWNRSNRRRLPRSAMA